MCVELMVYKNGVQSFAIALVNLWGTLLLMDTIGLMDVLFFGETYYASIVVWYSVSHVQDLFLFINSLLSVLLDCAAVFTVRWFLCVVE